MALRVDVHDDATAETDAATSWYRAEAGGDVARRFGIEIVRCMRAIGEAPARAPRQRDGTRRMRADGFPYVIVYDVHHDRVAVLAVMHTSRRPGYWSDRR